MSTARRQARPEGEAGIRNFERLPVRVQSRRRCRGRPRPGRSSGRREPGPGRGSLAEKSGRHGLTPCQTIEGVWPAGLSKKVSTPQGVVPLAEGDQLADEAVEVGVAVDQRPVDPTDLVVLAPGVVVALLGPEHLVAAQDHGHALRDQERRHQVAGLAGAELRGRLGSSVGPSTPQFQAEVRVEPSRFPSPLISLCLALYETRSARVKPSWQVMKLIEWSGPRPWQTSSEPQSLGWPGPRSCRLRPARTAGRRRGTGRSRPTSDGRRESWPPGRARRRPRARRSSWCRPAARPR